LRRTSATAILSSSAIGFGSFHRFFDKRDETQPMAVSVNDLADFYIVLGTLPSTFPVWQQIWQQVSAVPLCDRGSASRISELVHVCIALAPLSSRRERAALDREWRRLHRSPDKQLTRRERVAYRAVLMSSERPTRRAWRNVSQIS
jgi:hypothetical protein